MILRVEVKDQLREVGLALLLLVRVGWLLSGVWAKTTKGSGTLGCLSFLE